MTRLQKFWRQFVAISLVVSLLAFVTSVNAQGKKGKPPKDDPPPQPPVLYHIDEIPIFFPGVSYARNKGVNNKGQVVGALRINDVWFPYQFDLYEEGAAPPDLNFLNEMYADGYVEGDLPPGFHFDYASAINNHGDIVGRAIKPGDENNEDEYRGFLLEKFEGAPWKLSLVPGDLNSEAWDVNDWGVVLRTYEISDGNWELFLYDPLQPESESNPKDLGVPYGAASLNNEGQVAGKLSGTEPGWFFFFDGTETRPLNVSSTTDFPGANYGGLSDSGVICGSAHGVSRNVYQAWFRMYTALEEPVPEWVDDRSGWTNAYSRQVINSTGDMSYTIWGKGNAGAESYLLHTGFENDNPRVETTWNLADLVVSDDETDPALFEFWNNVDHRDISFQSDRIADGSYGAVGYGFLLGKITVEPKKGPKDSKYVILTPYLNPDFQP